MLRSRTLYGCVFDVAGIKPAVTVDVAGIKPAVTVDDSACGYFISIIFNVFTNFCPSPSAIMR
jgi:hypothetical protein